MTRKTKAIIFLIVFILLALVGLGLVVFSTANIAYGDENSQLVGIVILALTVPNLLDNTIWIKKMINKIRDGE